MLPLVHSIVIMSTRLVIASFYLIVQFSKCFCALGGSLPFVFYTEELPEDRQLMPTLGNGHVGFTVFSDSVYMNGVYNGQAGLSHRGRVPNYSNISVTPAVGNHSIAYILNVETGIFQINIENNDMKIIHLIYAHRFYNRAIINQVYVTRLHSEGALRLNIRQKSGQRTEDINFSEPLTIRTAQSAYDQNPDIIRNNQSTIHLIQGYTTQLEDENYQKSRKHVCCLWNHVPEEITLPPDQRSVSYRFVMTVDEFCSVAKQEITDVLGRPAKNLLKSHRSEWVQFWSSFRIRVEDNLKLQKTIYGSLFYIASSLPSFKTNHPVDKFYGLSPTGLGRGGTDLNDYEGHSFWDTEIWMFPAIMHMDPRWAKQLLNYRFRMLDTARDNAKRSGYKGARFPWESAYTGVEVVQPCCPLIGKQQIHITADISLATRSYFAQSFDLEWLNNEGCPLAENIAEFWADRVEYDVNTGLYDIKYVMGPDEDHTNVTNNAFTNVVAKYALDFGEFSLAMCNMKWKKKHPAWSIIAKRLKIPYDEKLDYHPQYEGYDTKVIIKQADAVLLAYPLFYPMNQTTRRNDLEIYEMNTRDSGPAMTWAIHSINHLDIGEHLKADMNFERGFENYVRQPFQVWSEVIAGHKGATNFLTGAGGFLQSIINGYAGVRIHLGYMEVRKPFLLPNTKKFSITGIKYLGSSFKIIVGDQGSLIRCLLANLDFPLKLFDENDSYDITTNLIFNITTKRIVIKPRTDIFNTKWKLKDWWKMKAF